MKPFQKSQTITKRPEMPFAKNLKTENPIKCLKSSLAIENQVHLFSPVTGQKFKDFYQKTKSNVNEKKSVEEEKKILLCSSLNRLPKVNLSQNNWYKRTQENFFKISNDNASLKLDLSDSFTLSQGKEKEKEKEIEKEEKPGRPIKFKEVIIPKQKKSQGNLISNQRILIQSKKLYACNNNNGNINTRSNSNTNTNTNANSKKNHHKEDTNKDLSTFLNYNLGNMNNFTQVDSVLLDNKNNNDLIKSSTAAEPEVEINLSRVSIKYDSFLQWGKIQDIKALRHSTMNNNLFSNNSIYYYDTNEYVDGEKKNEIYSLIIKDNTTKSKQKHCLTEANDPKVNNGTGRNFIKKEPLLSSKNRTNHTVVNIANKTNLDHCITKPSPTPRNDTSNGLHYKKLSITNYIKTSRSYFQ